MKKFLIVLVLFISACGESDPEKMGGYKVWPPDSYIFANITCPDIEGVWTVEYNQYNTFLRILYDYSTWAKNFGLSNESGGGQIYKKTEIGRWYRFDKRKPVIYARRMTQFLLQVATPVNCEVT